jgi:hypothetical protein
MAPRICAFLIHFSASSVLALMAAAVVFFVWYPAPMHLAVGVTAIFVLILGVDVVMGPVLTLIVFNKGKKNLRFDLSVIVACQLVAFAYGLWTVAEGRPAWAVFNVDRFDIVQACCVDYRKADQIPANYRHPSWFGPGWVSAKVPTDVEARNTMTFEAVFGHVDLPQRADLYKPLSAEAEQIRAKAFPMERLLKFNSAEEVQAVRQRWPQADSWLPMMSKAKSLTVLLHRETAEVVAVVDLRPWE